MRSVASAFILTILSSVPAGAAVTVSSQPIPPTSVKDLGPPRGVCVGTEDECKAKKKDEKPAGKQGLLGRQSIAAG